MMHTKKIGSTLLLILVLIVVGYLAFHPSDIQNVQAAPMNQQAVTQPWFDQTITTGGVTAIVDSGTAKEWAAFLHIDAPAAAESYTMTIGGRAIIGTTVYSQTLDLITVSAHEFSVAQNVVVSKTYATAEMWPQHFVTVNCRNASCTGDLLWLQGR